MFRSHFTGSMQMGSDCRGGPAHKCQAIWAGISAPSIECGRIVLCTRREACKASRVCGTAYKGEEQRPCFRERMCNPIALAAMIAPGGRLRLVRPTCGSRRAVAAKSRRLWLRPEHSRPDGIRFGIYRAPLKTAPTNGRFNREVVDRILS